MAQAVGGRVRDAVVAATGKAPKGSESLGPIKTLTSQVQFQEVHLLTNKPGDLGAQFANWVGAGTTAHSAKLRSPIDYPSIYEAADSVLSKVTKHRSSPCPELCIHLSPGTPAMTAVWVLLGKSRFPATFYQTHDGKVVPTPIPFDLVVDFLPELLRSPDRTMELLASQTATPHGFERLTGTSTPLKLAVARARRVALRDVAVLILGESGVGKEMFARGIHEASRRRGRPFVAINCAAIPKDLLESELFGHKKGGFTGATADRAGAFEEAHTGTLFLDEVGECDLAMQAKLLRVLQPGPGESPSTRTFRRIGESKDRQTDVRVVAATNRDLQSEIRAGSFREDLFYRLATFTLRLPSLRDRPTDIPVIAEALLSQINSDFEKSEPGFQHKQLSPSTKRFLIRQTWPGNVRQLQNVLMQAAVMSTGQSIEPPDIEDAMADSVGGDVGSKLDLPLGEGFSLIEFIEGIQRRYLARAMQESGGKKTVAAKLLGYPNYQTLSAQLDRLKVDWDEPGDTGKR
jgi:DNA-binding NtrC family response regulator